MPFGPEEHTLKRDYRVTIVQRLLDHLVADSVPHSVDLTDAGLVPGWTVQRRTNTVTGKSEYQVWKRPIHVKLSKPDMVLSRPMLVHILKEYWIDDAALFVGMSPNAH